MLAEINLTAWQVYNTRNEFGCIGFLIYNAQNKLGCGRFLVKKVCTELGFIRGHF